MDRGKMLVKNILIGEDIRQEVGNKLSLMGIVGSSINIEIEKNVPKEKPVQVSLAFLISIENSDKANDPKDFEIHSAMSLGENKLLDIKAKIESTGDDRVYHLPVPRIGIGVSETSELLIHVQIFKNGTLISEDKAGLTINLIRNQ